MSNLHQEAPAQDAAAPAEGILAHLHLHALLPAHASLICADGCFLHAYHHGLNGVPTKFLS